MQRLTMVDMLRGNVVFADRSGATNRQHVASIARLSGAGERRLGVEQGFALADPELTGIDVLYRLEARHPPCPAIDNVSISNGRGWSPDGTTVAYYVVSATQRIDAFDYDDARGKLGNRRELYITKSTLGQAPDREPAAGNVFTCELAVSGFPPYAYRG